MTGSGADVGRRTCRTDTRAHAICAMRMQRARAYGRAIDVDVCAPTRSNGAMAMEFFVEGRSEPDPAGHPIRGACLVEGCGCKDARIVSQRRVAFFARWAREHGETADRAVEPDPDWRELTRPWRETLSPPPERPGLPALTIGPRPARHPGW